MVDGTRRAIPRLASPQGAIPCSILFPTSFRYLKHTKDEITGELIRDRLGKPLLSGSRPEEFRFAKIYNVSDFIEGYCPQRTVKEMIVRINRTIKLTKPDLNRISRASKLCDEWNRKQCKTTFAGSQACYDPTQDTIKMPALPDFDSVDEFYGFGSMRSSTALDIPTDSEGPA